MTPSLKKRFWKDATVEKIDAGYAVHLDKHPLKTPAKASLQVPTRALAQAIAQEWRAQDDKVDPATMPMTRRANAAIDKVAPQRAEVAAMLADYGGSDLICYRAGYPEALAERQAAAWDPLIGWAARELNAPLEATTGVIHKRQDAASLENLRAAVFAFDVFALTALHDLVAMSGSLVIALAAINGYSDATGIWQTSRIDEIWQEEQWGPDDEATRVAALKQQDFLDAFRFYTLVAQENRDQRADPA